MGTENAEAITEIEVLTPEQVKALPDSVKENVVFLTENVRPKELMVLNPLVSSLLDLRRRAEKLELKKDEEGKFTKESIDEYKSLKADQRSFNGALTKTAKKLQKPYQDINKGFIEIKNTFKDLSDEVKAEAEEKFAEYEAEKERKKKEAEEKKNAETQAMIDDAKAEAEVERQKNAKVQVYNTIKYTRIAEEITEKANDAIIESNEEALCRFKAQLAQKSFETIKEGLETELLDEEVLTELEQSFDRAKVRAVTLIDEKIEKYEEDREKVRQEALNAVPPPPAQMPNEQANTYDNWPNNEDPEPMNPDVPTGIPVPPTDQDEAQFIREIKDQVYGLRNRVLARIQKGSPSEELSRLYSELENVNYK